MRWPDNRIRACTALILLVATIFFTGCAQRPWTKTIEGEAKEAVEAAFLASVSAWSRCGPGSESKLAVTWRSPSQTYSFEAYCQLLEPSYLKLALTSPLGLPLMVVATNSQTYQVLDASKQTSITGNLSSWAAQNNIPSALIESPWISWLTGRTAVTPSQIAEVRLDQRHRGAWLKIIRDKEERLSKEFILYDSESDRVIRRIIMDDFGRVGGIISYDRWQQSGDCPRPAEIAITGLPYNASAKLLFFTIEQASLAPGDFNLAVPASFQKIPMD
jgi:outer membrane biogenesis lipoprotein LolB